MPPIERTVDELRQQVQALKAQVDILRHKAAAYDRFVERMEAKEQTEEPAGYRELPVAQQTER